MINGYLNNQQMEALERVFNSDKYPVYRRLAETAFRHRQKHLGTDGPYGKMRCLSL